MDDSMYIQEYLAHLPEGCDYGFQVLEDGAGWQDDWEIVYCRKHSFTVPKMMTYDRAAEAFRVSEGTCRVVKYSRYLAETGICVHLVKRYKEAVNG